MPKKDLISDKQFVIIIGMKQKPIPKMTTMELAHKCGVYVDTIRRSRRQGYCTFRMAGLLAGVTGIPRQEWFCRMPGQRDPWELVTGKGWGIPKP